jgi:potassium-transporting ATPase KdpC subunit
MGFLRKVPRSFAFLIAMTIIVGVAYPAAVAGVAQLCFPKKADGSLIVKGGVVRGSTLLAQDFASSAHFMARPSATDYAYIGSGASNLAPTSAALAKAAAERRAAWEAAFGAPAPEEMLYASASGLDPDIGLEAALAQVPAVAAARGMSAKDRDALAASIREEAQLSRSLVGPERINVVALNARMDAVPEASGTGE